MGRKSLKEVRQREIIQIFYKVAKKEGLENTSIAKIAKMMDINPSLIIHYFQTKEELIYALIDYILDKYLLIYKVGGSKDMSLMDTLINVIDGMFSKKWNKLFDDGLFYSCYALSFRDEKVNRMYKRLSDALRSKLATLLQRCIDEQVIQLADAHYTAGLIFVLVDGSYYYLSMFNDRADYQSSLVLYKQEAYRLLGLEIPVLVAGP